MNKRIPAIIALVILIIIGFYWTEKRRSQPLATNTVSAQRETAKKNGEGGTSVHDREQKLKNVHLVVAASVGQELVNDRLTAIGSGKAVNTVLLTPWSNGTIEKIYVSAGEQVKQGDRIAKLDSDEQEIAFEKANIQVNDANLALARIEKLRLTNTATEVQEINAKLNLANAKLAQRDAKLALDRRIIRSPTNGVVGILPVDSGNYVTTEQTIARIDDRSKILIDLWIPERFAPMVKIGDVVEARSIARPGEAYSGKISAIDNMIDEDSRTLRIRAELDNANDLLRAGMSFEVGLTLKGDRFPTVDPLAIQWQSSGSYVWKIDGDHVSRVDVRIVQRNSDKVLVAGDLTVNDLVVIQGVQSLQPDSLVQVNNAPQLADRKLSQLQ